jgi:hypothetical protein
VPTAPAADGGHKPSVRRFDDAVLVADDSLVSNPVVDNPLTSSPVVVRTVD